MKLQIITVGKKNSLELNALIGDYEKSISIFNSISWILIKPSSLPQYLAINKESEEIIKMLPDKSIVWLLDERGQQLNNYQLTEKITGVAQEKDNCLVIIIGGPYGVTDQVKEKANFIWSMSKLVFPHQLIRLLLTEQLYRSNEIIKNSGYHHT